MSEKRSLRDVFAEARAEIQQWPASMKQLNDFRREEVRKLDEARLAEAVPVLGSKR